MLPRTQPYQNSGSGDTHAGLFEDIGTRSLQTVRIGEGAGKIASGTNSVYIGYETGKAATTSSFCVYAGYQAGALSTESSFSTLIGAYAGRENRGSEVTFVGYKSGELNRNGSRLVAIGNFSMRENVSGTGSVAVGYRALERSLDGDYNVVLGTEACQDLRSGSFNTAAGHQSCRAAFQNNYGCYFGAYSGYSNALGDGNSLFGFKSGYNMTSGSYNVGIGPFTLFDAREGSCNIAIGPFAGASMATTEGSVIIGNNASANSTSGAFNVVIGTDSGLCNDGDNNVLLGARVSQFSSLSSSVVIGADSAPNIDGFGSVILGAGVAQGITIGSCNVLIGKGADGYRSTVNSAIAIGTNKTFTSTNSISIGDDIVNERTSSILMGYSLKSDANNSVIMGNDINIQSVIYWKDPLNFALVETVASDALTKLGISNITYGTSNQVLRSPSGEVYNNAIVGLITSNVYNSVTSPRSLPVTPSSFDLRAIVSPSNYLLVQGRAYPIRDDEAASNVITIEGKIDTNIPTLPSSLSNQVSLSNFLSYHDLIVPLSNISANTVINIIEFGGTTTDIPVSFPKTAAVSHSPTTSSNAIYTLPILSNPSTPLIMTPPPLFTTPTGVHEIPNASIQYSIIKPPKLGKLNAARFASNATIEYTPFVEATFASSDSFQVRPVKEIVDANSQIFGCPSSNDVTITISMPTTSLVYHTPQLTTIDGATLPLTCNILRTIPSPIPPSTPLRIMGVSSNLTVTYTPTSTTFTSNMIATMIAEDIHLYPSSAYEGYIDQQYDVASAISLSNVVEYQSTYDGIFGLEIPAQVVSLSNYLVQTLSNLIADPLDPMMSNYVPITDTDPVLTQLITIADLSIIIPSCNIYPSSNQLEYAYGTYSNAFATWTQTYDTSLSYIETQTIYSCNVLYESSYLFSPRITYDFLVHSYAAALASNHEAPSETSSNIIQSAISFPFPTTYSTYPTLAASLDALDTLLYKYYEAPRLFLTYQDLIHENVQLSNLDQSVVSQCTLELDGSPILFNIQNVRDPLWSEFPTALPDRVLPRNKTVPMTQSIFADASSNGISNIYVDTYPQHGQLSYSNYQLFNPWMTQDQIRIVVQKEDGKTADTSWNIRYNAEIAYEPSLTVPRPPTLSVIQGTYDTVSNIVETLVTLSNVSYTTQCNIAFNGHLTSNLFSNIDIIAVGAYDPSKGILVATSNLTTCNVLTNVWEYDPMSIDPRSNVLIQYSIIDFTEVIDAGVTLSNTTLVTLSNITSNVFDPTIDISYPFVTSNIVIYETSNIFHDYTRQQDTYIERIGFDVSHLFHFAAHDPTYFLDQQNSLVTVRPEESVQSNTFTTIASRSNVSIFTSNIIQHSNISVYDPLFPLSRGIVYQSDPSYVYHVSSESMTDVVRSNIGSITTFTQSSLDLGNTWLRLPSAPSPTIVTVPFTLSNLPAIQCTLVPSPSTQVMSPYSSMIALSNMWQTCNLSVWDEALALTALADIDTIHIQNIQHGVLHNGVQYAMTFPFDQRADIYYVATSNNYYTDTIDFYFGASITDTFSDVFRANVTLQRTPYTSAQDVNCGLRFASSNILSSHGFISYFHEPTTIAVTSVTNAVLSKMTFQMNEVLASQIYVSVVDCEAPASFMYDIRSEDESTTFAVDQLYDLRAYDHVAFPRTAEFTGTQLRIQQLGNMAHASNVLVGGLWNRIGGLKTSDAGTVAPQEMNILFEAPLVHGFLWNETTEREVPMRMTLQDLQSNNILYVPYQSNVLRNETTTMRFLFEDVVSPPYAIDIKNYISRFPQLAIDKTVRAPQARQVNIPALLTRSQGLITDGLAWTPSSTLTLPQQFTSPLQSNTILCSLSNLYTEPLQLTSYTHSKPVAWSSLTPINVSLDQADRWSLRPVVTRVLQEVLEERDIVFYLTEPPEHGIILDITSGCNVVQFTDTQLLANRVVYQHIGANTSNDTFQISLSSTPYDLVSDDLVIHVNPRAMPSIIANTEAFVYHSNIASALATDHPLGSNIRTDGIGYVHILNTNVNIPQTSPLSTVASLDLSYQLSSSYFAAHGTTAPFPPIQMRIAVNQTSLLGYVNPLVQVHPTYEDLFVIPFTAHLNRFVNSNVITETQDAVQVVSYDIDRSLPASSNLAGRIVTYFLQVNPIQSVFDTTTDVQDDQIDFLRTFEFEVDLVGENESTLCALRFQRHTVELSTLTSNLQIPIPTNLVWNFGEWHNILFINQDPDNNNFASVYIDYDLSSSRVQNAARNIFANESFVVPDLGTIKHIYLATDMQSASNYSGPHALITRSAPNDGLGTSFELQNNRTQLQYRNQEVYITTYSLEETQTGTVSTIESLNHNVVIGKEITVRGTNNICIGNRFVTSGRNSIILGNDIGKGAVDLGTINDVYESIVIGNESFQNSIVRDVISIGNRNLNNLFESPVDRVNEFLSQRPILIGNDISQDRLDFNINIGNAFTKTIIGGPQIYVGLANEVVGIGYTSNASLSNGFALHVNGGVDATEVRAPVHRGFTKEIVRVYSHSNISPAVHDIVVLRNYRVLDTLVVSPTTTSNNPAVFGVVDQIFDHGLADICIRGLTRVRVIGTVALGDLLTTSEYFGCAQSAATTQRHSYTLAKAMQSTDPLGPAIQIIECMCAV